MKSKDDGAAERGGIRTPASRPLAPLVESPISIYMAGMGIGIGCGALILLLLLGALGV